MDEITKSVAELYDKIPFQSENKNFEVLFKSLKPDFKSWLKDKKVCEIGCGPGHISNYVSQFCKEIYGFDISKNSLKHANKDKPKNAHFAFGNILEEEFVKKREESFDYVYAYGVIHHISDPNKAFRNVVRLVRPGGFVTIGVYSSYGGLNYRWRRFMVNLVSKFSKKSKTEIAKSMFYRNEPESLTKRVHLSDAYENPRVLFYTGEELLSMFRKEGLEIQLSYPPLEISTYPYILKCSIFGKVPPIEGINKYRSHNFLIYNRFTRWLIQLIWPLNGNRFGLFSISGKKIKRSSSQKSRAIV